MKSSSRFRDRTEAGKYLAELLLQYAGRADVIVLGLPRGGVPVALEVAARLRAPLDVFTVRKLGLPGFSELAMGAVAAGGIRVINEAVVCQAPISPEMLESATASEMAEVERREHLYRDGRPPLDVRGRAVILVDDGIATGSTMRAATEALRQRGAARLVLAVPVGSAEACRRLAEEVDETVCALTPLGFEAVGQYYDDFAQTTDDEVRRCLAQAAANA